ncbi:MAG TPA: glycosyltransferase family A protein [Thermoanaerobaculia bacterium]|nr:glycosyltransferase family A protein [Thermoanaerobaculia bacterium]
MPASPLISTVIPVCNGERFLAEAVDSAIRQVPAPFEVIVVDDGSTDGTAGVCRSLGERVRYVHQENAGPSAARNRGLEMARGDFIAFLDADDLWPAEKFDLQLARFRSEPSLEVVLGYSRPFADARDGIPGRWFDVEPRFMYQVGSGLFRRGAFERAGVFDPELRFSEDVDWFLRAREAGVPMVVLQAVTVLYRQHGRNMTRGRSTRDLGFIRVLQRSLERRREQNAGAVPLLPHVLDRSGDGT